MSKHTKPNAANHRRWNRRSKKLESTFQTVNVSSSKQWRLPQELEEKSDEKSGKSS